ncbi:MAG: phage portal protein [Oscillospiraceae bacterium]|nr:phage portal protein [Oscillospiraceae bacterium]
MARKFSLFNFLDKKIESAQISPVMQTVLDQVAFKELALHIAVSYIANTLSKAEFKTYIDGEEVKDALYYKLNISPNPNQNSSQFINQIVEQSVYCGSALVTSQGEYIYCADNFTIDDTNPIKENIFHNVTFNTHQLRKNLKSSDVFFFRLDNDSVKQLVDSLYLEYGQIISFALSAYKRTNGAKYKLLLEQYKAGDPQFSKIYEEVLKNQLKTFISADNNAIYPQYKGTDLQEFSSKTPMSTADIIAMRKEIFEVVAQSLKIPLTMMYGNITNMNEIVKVFLSNCIDPFACMIEEEITRKYFTFEEWKRGCRVEVDTTCINHVDIFEIADKADKAISSGLAAIDELRERIGLPVLGTEFSTQHYITKNYTPAEDALNSIERG